MSTQPEIRKVQPDEIAPWFTAMRTGLLDDPNASQGEAQLARARRSWDFDRVIGGYHDGRWVATLRTFASPLTVPAGPGRCAEIPVDALTQVTVAATHRRRGVLRSMLTRSLAEAKERGEVASLLRAAEWPIYGRFGYQVATLAADYTIDTFKRPSILASASPIEIRQVAPAEFPSVAAAVHRRVRLQRAGQLERTVEYWPMWLGLDGLGSPGKREPVCVIARRPDGEVDGYAVWRSSTKQWWGEPTGAPAEVAEVLASTGDGYRALWHYLINLDLVGVLSLEGYPVDEPLEWLLSDGRAARRTRVGDSEWLRLLDVPAALATRRYRGTDRLVLQVIDDQGGWAAGRFTLDGGPEHADCSHTPAATADLTMSQRALAGIYLGGVSVRSQQLAGLVDEHTAGAADRLESMFGSSPAPWNVTPF